VVTASGDVDADIVSIIEDVRARVLAQRVREGRAGVDADEASWSELQAAIQDVNLNARVNSHLPLLWDDLVFGRMRSLIQRVVRRLLRWYINPIVDQQNRYNAAVARAITLLAADNARLRRDLAESQAAEAAEEEANKTT